jgi:hypothetical protein
MRLFLGLPIPPDLARTLARAGGPDLDRHNFGCPIFGASFAPKVGIRATIQLTQPLRMEGEQEELAAE